MIHGLVVTSNTAGVSVPNNTTIVSISSNTAVLSNNVTGTGTPTFSAIGPSDTAADGGGIILDGTTDHTFTWSNANDSWQSSENIDIANGKTYNIIDGNGNARQMLSLTQIGPTAGTGVVAGLGSGVTSSVLTSVGSLTTLDVTGDISCGSSIGINGSGGSAYPLHVHSGQKYLVGLKNTAATDSNNPDHPWLVHDTVDSESALIVHFNGVGDRLVIKEDGKIEPNADNTQDLGSTTKRWANVYSADVHLNNTGTGGNDVDGSEGSWTMQEGADDLFLINRITGKKYKFNLTEV